TRRHCGAGSRQYGICRDPTRAAISGFKFRQQDYGHAVSGASRPRYQAGVVGPAGGCRLCFTDRLCERRQSAAGASRRPAKGDLGPSGSRGRWRLIRQLLTESLILALAGGSLGLMLGKAGVAMIVAAFPDSIPRSSGVGLDWQVVGFTALVA